MCGRSSLVILTDREIRISIERGLIEIAPNPLESAYSSTALDLTLDAPFRSYRQPSQSVGQYLDPFAEGFSISEAIDTLTTAESISSNGYDLNPNHLILAWTKERVNLKTEARIAARVEGKSSLARLGLLVHLTAPTIHAGFARPIQLEMVNMGKLPIRLRVGMPICQLIFEQTVGVAEKGYSGRFSRQSSNGIS